LKPVWLLGIAAICASAQQAPLPIQDLQVLPLWSGPAPGALGNTDADIPKLTVYLPRTTTPGMTAVIVMPGGGYRNLAMNHEGRQVANYLNSVGIAAFVLEYRLGPRYHHPIELGDAQRAIRLVRSHAPEWRIDPQRIGVLGFSAGGHLAATASTHFDAGQASAIRHSVSMPSTPDATHWASSASTTK
jgi:acetyl esterase/lipase